MPKARASSDDGFPMNAPRTQLSLPFAPFVSSPQADDGVSLESTKKYISITPRSQ